jgi:hypothetical protein
MGELLLIGPQASLEAIRANWDDQQLAWMHEPILGMRHAS